MMAELSPLQVLIYQTSRLVRRFEQSERDAVELAIFLVRGNTKHKCLNGVDVAVAKILYDKFGVDDPIITTVAMSNDESNLVSVAEVAIMMDELEADDD